MGDNSQEITERSERLQGEIWSKTLKYLDFVKNYKEEDIEDYYAYRDDKARELSEEIMALINNGEGRQ